MMPWHTSGRFIDGLQDTPRRNENIELENRERSTLHTVCGGIAVVIASGYEYPAGMFVVDEAPLSIEEIQVIGLDGET